LDKQVAGYFANIIQLAQFCFEQVKYTTNTTSERAIRPKYGEIGREHIGEAAPHLHLGNKMRLLLTETMTFADFVAWLENHIQER